MTQSDQKAPPYYPKSHLLAASGVAALLSLALLVFPSSEVEAKRTTLNLELESNTDRLLQEKDDLLPQSVTNSSDEGTPFAQVEGASDDNTAEQDSDKPGASVADADTKPVDPEWKTITVASGDTLSTVFTKAGLSTSAMHDMLTSSKDAKRFTHLKVGQEVKLKLDPKGELQALRVKQSELETIGLDKTDKGYSFKREKAQIDLHTAYAHGRITSSLFVAGRNAGLPYNLVTSLSNIFGYDIDFALDLREGDEFDVIYEQHKVNGKASGDRQYPRRPLRQPWQDLHRRALYQQAGQYQLLPRRRLQHAQGIHPYAGGFRPYQLALLPGPPPPDPEQDPRTQGRRLRSPHRHTDQGHRRRQDPRSRTQGATATPW